MRLAFSGTELNPKLTRAEWNVKAHE
jgi:hypothetical protein